jgi:hypothetical protein
MATTAIVFVAVRVVVPMWVLPFLVTPMHADLPLTSGTGLGFTPSSVGEIFTAGDPSLPDAWVLSSRIIDQSGVEATPLSLNEIITDACLLIAASSSEGGGGPQRVDEAHEQALHSCIDQLSTVNHLAVTHQPGERYWLLQWLGTALYIGLAAALFGVAVWWIRRRVA